MTEPTAQQPCAEAAQQPKPRWRIEFEDERDFCRFASILIGAVCTDSRDALSRFTLNSLHGESTHGSVSAERVQETAGEPVGTNSWLLAQAVSLMDMITPLGLRAKHHARAVLNIAEHGPTRESEAEQVLREIAAQLGVGGYNAPAVDAQLYREKILDGLQMFAQACRLERPAVPLAPPHKGMRVNLNGGLEEVIRALKASRQGSTAFTIEELRGHIAELGKRFYGGDLAVVDEFLQLYHVAQDKRPRQQEADSTAAHAGVTFCNHCGEGVTDFCRAKPSDTSPCPKGLTKPPARAAAGEGPRLPVGWLIETNGAGEVIIRSPAGGVGGMTLPAGDEGSLPVRLLRELAMAIAEPKTEKETTHA